MTVSKESILKKQQGFILDELVSIKNELLKIISSNEFKSEPEWVRNSYKIWHKSLIDGIHIIDPGFD